jgi:Zn-finger nucleic acid-binding protein
MPEWLGGPCHVCGEDMPARLVHCRSCRALLNSDLEEDSIEIPLFVPMQELDCKAEMTPRGIFVACPHCEEELRINVKYAGEMVGCKHCEGRFLIDLTNPVFHVKAYYGDCPHCTKELRISKKYMGIEVACKFCGGKLKLEP